MMFVSMGAGGGIFALVLLGSVIYVVYRIDKKLTTPAVELYKREKIKEMARHDVRNAGKNGAFSNLNKIIASVNRRKPKKPEGETIF